MATTAPVSAPASAPSSGSTGSTGGSTPSVPSTPATGSVAPPAPPAAAEAPAPAITVDSAAAPPEGTSSAPAAGPLTAEPKASDYPNTRQGQQEFLEAHMTWDLEHPEGAATEQAPAVEGEPAPAEAAAVEAAAKPVETEDDDAAPEEVSVNPEVVNQWFKDNPALDAALPKGSPIRNEMYAMARTNERAKELLKIYPNAQAAKWANEQGRFVADVRGAFTAAADDPSRMPQAMELFSSQFMMRDKDGNPLKDAGGNPRFHKDFEMLAESFVTGTLDDLIGDYQELVDKEDAEADTPLSALKYVKKLIDEHAGKGEASAPDRSLMTPEQRRLQDQLDARAQELGLTQTKLTADQKKAVRTNWEKSCNTKIGALVGRSLKEFMAAKAKDKVFLPSYVTDVKNADGQSVFAQQLFDKFNAEVLGVSWYRQQLHDLANADPTPENEEARVKFYGTLVADILPGLMEKELRAIQKKDKADRKAQQGSAADKAKVAELEPLGGSATGQGGAGQLTDEQLMEKARAEVAASHPDVSQAKRLELTLNRFNQLSTPSLRTRR